jgi:hypothetical protein
MSHKSKLCCCSVGERASVLASERYFPADGIVNRGGFPMCRKRYGGREQERPKLNKMVAAIASVATLLLGLTIPAKATTLPPAQTTIVVCDGIGCLPARDGTFSQFESFASANASGNTVASLGTDTSPPLVHVGAVSAGAPGEVSADANVQYFFTVDGGPSGVSVPLNISATGFALTVHGGTVHGVLDLFSAASGIVTTLGTLNVGLAGSQIFSTSMQFTAITGDLFAVEMSIIATAPTGALLAPGSAAGEIDPHISFVNAADASTFTLEFSPNVIDPQGTAVTPLPGTLPLFATGLAGLGLLGWRRKKTAAG